MFKSVLCILIFLFETGIFSNDIKTYGGFPVYPPEQIDAIEDNAKEFSFPFSEIVPPIMFSEGVNNPEEKSNRTSLRQEIAQWKKDLTAFNRQAMKAKSYILRNAKNLDWTLFDQLLYNDGGSFGWKFQNKEKTILVKVVVWKGEATTRGTVSYSFQKILPPASSK